jgi:hypothetical protein
MAKASAPIPLLDCPFCKCAGRIIVSLGNNWAGCVLTKDCPGNKLVEPFRYKNASIKHWNAGVQRELDKRNPPPIRFFKPPTIGEFHPMSPQTMPDLSIRVLLWNCNNGVLSIGRWHRMLGDAGYFGRSTYDRHGHETLTLDDQSTHWAAIIPETVPVLRSSPVT